MTVATEISRSGPYAGAGSPGPFTVGFRFLDQTHLEVIRTTSGIQTTLELGTDYTVAGVGNPTGSVTLVAPLAIGSTLTIIRAVPRTQEADYVQNDNFPAESHENALDKLTMITQELDEKLERALAISATLPPGVDTVLPPPLAQSLLGWNETADAIKNYPLAQLATSIAYGTQVADLFDGTGAQTTFTLSAAPGSQANMDVSISGVTQRPGIDYTLAGADIIFATAPPVGTDNILVRHGQALLQLGASERGIVHVADFGADGFGNDTAEIMMAIAAAGSSAELHFDGTKTYTFTQLVFPAGMVVKTNGATLRSDGSLTGVGTVTISVGNGCEIDQINLSTPGTETNGNPITIGTDCRIGGIEIVCDVQHGGGGGIVVDPQNTRIDYVRTVNVDRPFHFYNTSATTQANGAYLGYLECESYIRGFRADFCSFTTGNMRMRGLSPHAVVMTPGQNGVLIQGCRNFQMGQLYIANSSEHAFRVGGSPNLNARTEDFSVESIFAEACNGCTLKLNPGMEVTPGVLERCQRFSFGRIVSVDGGVGSMGGNKELLRLSHSAFGHIGSAESYTRDYAVSSQIGLLANDIKDITIGHLHCQSVASGFIAFDDTSDGGTGYSRDISNIHIMRLSGSTGGNNAIQVGLTVNISNIHIGDMNIGGHAVYLVRWDGGTLTGPFDLRGRTFGITPAFFAPPAGSNFTVDLRYGVGNYVGHPSGLAFGVTAPAQIATGQFSASNTPASHLVLSALSGTGGAGTFGSAIEFSRIGSTRRGAAVALKQFGANAFDNGFEFLTGSGPTATDALNPCVRFTHERVMQIVDGVTAPATVAGWASIYVDTADGDLKIKFGDGTVKTIVIDT